MKHSFTKRLKLVAMAITLSVSGAINAQDWTDWNTEGTDGVNYQFEEVMSEDGLFTLELMAPEGKMEIISRNERDEVFFRELNNGENRFNLNKANGPYLCAIHVNNTTRLEVLRIGVDDGKSLGNVADIKVYPNPSSDVVKMDVKEGEEGVLRILDMNGNVMTENQLRVGQNIIEVSEFPKGFYIAEYVTEKGIQQKTLIKE